MSSVTASRSSRTGVTGGGGNGGNPGSGGMTVDGVFLPYVEHFPPDTTACIFWLKNRRPEVWRERVIVDANVRREAEGLTDEELIRIARGGSPGAASPARGPAKPDPVH